MGLKVSGQVRTSDLGMIGGFPGGVRGTAEHGHVRASEGGFIDLPIGIFSPRVLPAQKLPPPRKIDRRDVVVPVGPSVAGRRDTIVEVQSLPEVREQRKQPVKVLPKANGGLPPQIKTTIPSPPSALPKLPPQILNPPVITKPKPAGPIDVLIDIIKPKETPVALDLGQIFTTAAGVYRDINVARAAPVYDWQGLNPFSDVPLDQSIPINPGLDTGGGGCCNSNSPGRLPPGYKYNQCGQVVKKRRRRRRRLATASDIKDLSALSSVTTPAEKKAWIATHPS